MSERLTPKYLTKELAESAVDMVLNAFVFTERYDHIIRKNGCYIVIVVPSIETAHRPFNSPDQPLLPKVLYERGCGILKDWVYPFDKIARAKALQLWRDQNTDGNTDVMPHLLFPDDTQFWGGVKRHGIVVACSGFQPYFDQMISGMIADAIKAFARYEFEKSEDRKEGRTFLT